MGRRSKVAERTIDGERGVDRVCVRGTQVIGWSGQSASIAGALPDAQGGTRVF